MIRGNCYYASEALYHILGGSKSLWKPMVMRHEGKTHWFLEHKDFHIRIDPSILQFEFCRNKPDYSKARGCGFLTKKPSRKAALLMARLTWQME